MFLPLLLISGNGMLLVSEILTFLLGPLARGIATSWGLEAA